MNTPKTDLALDAVAKIKPTWLVPPVFIDHARQLERDLAAEERGQENLRRVIAGLETQVNELREALEASQKIAIEYAEEMACTPLSGVCRQIEKNALVLERTK